MMKEILCFTTPCHLSINHSQLAITQKETGEYHEKPIDDLGIIMIEHPAITITQALIAHLSYHGVAVLFCNRTHEPCSLLLHMEGHSTQTHRFRTQINSSTPLKKQLWQQVVKAKITNQQCLLDQHGINLQLPDNVCSGDSTHVEAQAARLYWPALFYPEFIRGRYGRPPNPALNYGYAILRAATARALSLAGLLPMLGIHHKNKYNNFCLADDIMEPYRPFIDRVVKKMCDDNMACGRVDSAVKKALLSVLHEELVFKKENTTLMIAIQRTAQSLAQCFSLERKKICYPKLLPDNL